MKLIFAALLFASTAHAACNDQAAPGVNWAGCRVEDSLNLSRIVLHSSNFDGSTMRFTLLDGADLGRSSFVGAKLILPKFQGTNLKHTNFTDAVVYLADFTDADLRGATFTRTNLVEVKMTGALLSGAKWLDGSKLCAEGSVGECK